MEVHFNVWMIPVITVLSAIMGLALIPVARKVGLVDHPGGRKVHDSATPLSGGPAVFLVFSVFVYFYLGEEPFAQALLAGGGLIFVVGLVDDIRHIHPLIRFAVQVTACLAMVFHGNVWLEDFGQLFTPHVLTLAPVHIPITIFAALGVINAFNMIDGMDGLSGGIFTVAVSGLALYAGFAGAFKLHWLLLAALFSVLGFLLVNGRLPWNRRARVFLGDSGSTLLGFVLAWCFIALGSDQNETGQRAYMPMTAVWLIAVPLWDTSTLIWRRTREGRSPLNADRNHLHHAFLRTGHTTGETWIWIVFLAVLSGLTGAAFELSGLPEYVSFWFFIACSFAYFLYMQKTWRKRRFLGRDFVN